MLLHDINHKMPIYKDCTLGEILLVGVLVFLIEVTLLSLLTWLFFHYAFIGVALTFISFFHLTKAFLSQLQKVKHGKPHGFYKQWLIKKLAELHFIRPFYLTRSGKWSVRRK